MKNPTWITNSPKAAKILLQADDAYTLAREAAKHLPLEEKVIAYRKATIERSKAYEKAAK